MNLYENITERDIRELKKKIMTDLSPDLRELTTYCRLLHLAKYKFFEQPKAYSESAQQEPKSLHAREAINLASYTDQALAHAVSQISDFKMAEASLTGQKESSLRSMSKILASLAQKALDRSRSTGSYVHITHVFYEEFSPSSVVSKNTFYGYKSAVTRYALKRVADLLPCLPTNVDRKEIISGFQRMTKGMVFEQTPAQAPYPTNVDNKVDNEALNAANRQPHRLTALLLDFTKFENVELDPKLSVYPWFAKRRHRTPTGIPPMLTKAEMVDLAECIRFVCHYPPDLKFERRGIAGKKRSREFVFGEIGSDGLLLNAPKPQFSKATTIKRVFDRSTTEAKAEIGKRDKRLASTAFQPSHFWLDVAMRVNDQATKEVIATQLITGCRPSELVEGVIVSTQPTDEQGSLGRLHFTVFGAKTKAPPVAAGIEKSQQVGSYLQFLETSSMARNSKIRGQFYHTESHEVFTQFPERVWLYNLLSERHPQSIDNDREHAIQYLLEKVCHYQRTPKGTALTPEVIYLRNEERNRLRQRLAKETGKQDISDADIFDEVRRLNAEAQLDQMTRSGKSSSSTEDFEKYVVSELQKIRSTRTTGDVRIVSPYQTARIVRFAFLPQQKSYPRMAELDGILHIPANVDISLDQPPIALPRVWLLNEFSENDLWMLRIPETQAVKINDREFAELVKERADYVSSAVIQLGKRYKSAASGGTIEPTPYLARHKLISDLKGLRDDAGNPIFSQEDIARKAGHASTSSQTGYGKTYFAEKGSENRGKSLKAVKSAQDVKNPKATANLREFTVKNLEFERPAYRPRPRNET